MSDGHLMPLLRFERLFGLEANRIIVPIACDTDVDLALIEMDSKALALRVVGHARHQATIRRTVRVDPGRKRELISSSLSCPDFWASEATA